jgi:hypothetical protein
VPALMLTAATGGWAVVASHNDLVITITGHDHDPDSLSLALVIDPVTTFGPPSRTRNLPSDRDVVPSQHRSECFQQI